jgi:hypothetical protein
MRFDITIIVDSLVGFTITKELSKVYKNLRVIEFLRLMSRYSFVDLVKKIIL